MGNIVCFLEHKKGRVLKASLSALKAALELKAVWSSGEVIGLVLGSAAKEAAENLKVDGLSKVVFSENASLEKYVAGNFAHVVMECVKSNAANTLVAAATSTGKDFMPRLAGLWRAGQASDISAVNSDGSLKRLMYAGNVSADVEILTANRVVTVRPTAFAPVSLSASSAKLEELNLGEMPTALSEVLSYEISAGDRPELADAEIVVSGGRALQSAENFQKYIYPLADALKAAVGASRAAVDSGFAPNDWQVGQTGKVVAPQLYIAIGISGAIQHLAGMKDSKVIVAINKDAEAPIFEVADFGLVADPFETVPKLTEAIKQIKSK